MAGLGGLKGACYLNLKELNKVLNGALKRALNLKVLRKAPNRILQGWFSEYLPVINPFYITTLISLKSSFARDQLY